MLTGKELGHILKKAQDFGALTTKWEKEFLPSIVRQKKSGKTLTSKQLEKLIGVITTIIVRAQQK